MKLVIIGSGNVANVLGRQLYEAGHIIVQVAGRNHEAVQVLADSLKARACFAMNEIVPDADMYILALGDAALYTLDLTVRPQHGVVVHTAGSVPTSVLAKAGLHYGVLYPLQTLNKSDLSIKEIPFLVNGNTRETIELISQLASTISGSVSVLDDEKRAKIHLAAAVVNNFSNHLFALAYDFCRKEAIDFSLLAPLIARTAELAAHGDPALKQTGPATRKDLVTIEKHEQMLSDYPALKLLYEQLTGSIIKLKEENEMKF